MKAMILAAGLGTRMRPLTHLCAKPALPVLNRPLIERTVEQLVQAGIDEIVVNLHHRPGTVRAALRDVRRRGVRVRYSHEAGGILGTGGGPRHALRWLGDGAVLIVNGDVLFDFDLVGLIARHRRAGALATLALRPNPDPTKYHPVLIGADGRVVRLPGCRRARRGRACLFTGVSVVETAMLKRLAPGPSDSVRDLFAPAVDAGELVQGAVVRGAWYDLGTPELYRRAQLLLLAREQHGGRGHQSRWRGSLVDPAARVARDAVIERSVIGAGVSVAAGAQVKRSILWGRATVGKGARVADAIVAGPSRVAAGEHLGRGVRVPDRIAAEGIA
jgi:mannose-1-phosphate guanylyltransferase